MIASTTDYYDQRAVGLFSSRAEAEQAMYKLRDSGFNMDHISVVAKSGDGLKEISGHDRTYDGAQSDAKPKSEQAKGGAGAGAKAGAATGGAIGLVGSLGVLAIPGIGPVAEVGFLLANTLLGGGIGAAGGGLLGALIGWGVPEDRAKHYDDRVHNHGDYLVMLEGSESEMRSAESILRQGGIRDWNIYSNRPMAQTR
jgi:uncharacterized membrane protein